MYSLRTQGEKNKELQQSLHERGEMRELKQMCSNIFFEKL